MGYKCKFYGDIMLGDSTLKEYFSDSYVADIKPMVTLEFNGNDYGDPYLYGTNLVPPSDFATSSRVLSLTPRSGAPEISQVDRGVETAINPTDSCFLIKVTGSNKKGTASENSFRYTADADAGTRNVKFHMFLKSDYTFQYQTTTDVDESFNVVLTATGLDSSGKLIKSEIVTETVDVNSVDWKSVTLMFANPDEDVNQVRLNIYISPAAGRKSSLLVSQLSYSSISPYEVYVKNRLSVEQVFKTLRPGEFMIDMPSNQRPNVKIDDEYYPQQCTPVQMCMDYAIGPKYRNVQRSVTPMPGNPYTYYVSGTDLGSKQVWAIYKNKIKTNKIVLKINALGINIKNFNIRILTSDGWSSNISPSGVKPDEHGILVLYLKGSSWSSTPWDNDNYPYIEDSGSNSLLYSDVVYNSAGSIQISYKEIYGISIDVSSMEAVNQDFSDYKISQARFELIELSPRLEVDVSRFVQSLEINEELSNNDSILPIGGITSNLLKLSISNIPITYPSTDFRKIPISSISSTSKLNNLLRKGVKSRILFKINTSNNLNNPSIKYLPAFTGFLEEWGEKDSEVSMVFYDAVKILQSTRTRPLYLKGNKVNNIIQSLFDTVGFGEFDAESLRKIKGLGRKNSQSQYTSNNDIVPHFWTTKERSMTETLFDLTKVFQIGIYCDAYGAVDFKSLHTFNRKYLSLLNSSDKSPDLYIQDFNDENSLSNLMSVNITESSRPESIIIRYITPRPSIGQDADEDASSKRLIKRPFGRDVVWTIDGADNILPYLHIADEGIQNASQSYIPYYVKSIRSLPRALPFSSMLLIDEEIVSYSGIEYRFEYKRGNQDYSFVRNIESPDDIESVVSEIFTEFNGRNIKYSETGRLLNVRRGLFGTPPTRHVKTGTNSISNWKMLGFTKSNNSYINGTNIPRKTGKWSETQNGIKITSKSNNEMLFLYPEDAEDDSPFLKNKRRMSTQIKLGDIPKNKEGYLGVGLGLEYDGNNKLINGLLIWVGVESGKKKQKPNAYVQQVKSDGTLETIISKNNFDYAEDLIEEDENIEIFVSLNDDRKRCKIFIGGTTLFQKTVKKKVEGKKKKKEIKKVEFDIRQLNKKSRFGVIASGAGVGVLGQMQFGVSKKPEDLNDLEISDIDDDYQAQRTKRPNRVFFIGNNTLLDNIVYGQNIAGINESSGDNFVYTGAPVGRGIRLFEVDYDSYPVIADPVHVWEGYGYDISIFERAELISEKEPDDIG